MRKIIFILIIVLAVLPVIRLRAQDVTFKVSAPPSVVMGAQFQITYMVNVLNGVDLRVDPEFVEVFNVLYGPATSQSSSTQINNGKRTTSQSTTYVFTVVAKKEGSFTIEPATIRIGNSEYKSNSFTINVLPPDQAPQTQPRQGGGAPQQSGGGNQASSPIDLSDNNVFMRMIISKNNVYEQEGFLVTFKIYSAYAISGITNPKFPEFEGFLAQDIEIKEIKPVFEQYKERNYHTAVVKQTYLYPQRSGQLQIGSGSIDVVFRVQSTTRGRSIFEDFFSTYQDLEKKIASSPVTIDVKPLPTGKPANFSSAVGSYTMNADINKTELKANEAVTIKLNIKGNGNIKLLKNPEVKFPNDFEVYDPVVANNINVTTTGASGTKTIEYMAIPRFAGDFEIPPIHFSYFDTQSGTYKTISTESYMLHVARDESSTDGGPVITNFTNRENVRFLGKDIRYLKTQKINFQPTKDIFFGSFLYIMAYLMTTILFIVFFVIYRKQVRENSNIALVRTKKANKTAVKRLKNAEKLLHENNEEAFYEEVLHALWGYMSDKLNIPQSALTKENVKTELSKYGVDESLSDEFMNIIHTCEYARYAPDKTQGAMDKLFGETIEAINKMENTIKK